MHARLLIAHVIVAAIALAAGGCASSERNSPEAAWRRGQCDQVVDPKAREDCMKRVDEEFGRRR